MKVRTAETFIRLIAYGRAPLTMEDIEPGKQAMEILRLLWKTPLKQSRHRRYTGIEELELSTSLMVRWAVGAIRFPRESPETSRLMGPLGTTCGRKKPSASVVYRVTRQNFSPSKMHPTTRFHRPGLRRRRTTFTL